MKGSSREYAMSFKQIAEQMTAEEGIEYTEDQVRQIYHRAMVKLRRRCGSSDSARFLSQARKSVI